MSINITAKNKKILDLFLDGKEYKCLDKLWYGWVSEELQTGEIQDGKRHVEYLSKYVREKSQINYMISPIVTAADGYLSAIQKIFPQDQYGSYDECVELFKEAANNTTEYPINIYMQVNMRKMNNKMNLTSAPFDDTHRYHVNIFFWVFKTPLVVPPILLTIDSNGSEYTRVTCGIYIFDQNIYFFLWLFIHISRKCMEKCCDNFIHKM